MTEPTPLSDVPDDIGRNDPCPCGSGKKYKKCCMRAHRVQQEAKKSSRQPHELINDATTPWDMFKLLVQVRENNMPNFFWELSHESGSFRERYPTKESYFEALGNGEEHMVAREGFDLSRIRHDAGDVMLLLTRGENQPSLTSVDAEVVHMRKNQVGVDNASRVTPHPGWRVWNVERHERKKADLDGEEVTLTMLGYEWTREN